MILNKVRFMVPTLLLCFVTFMLVGTADVFAQSTDENNPTPVTTDILNGEVGRTDERGTYYYVLEVRRSETIQADLSLTFTSGIAFSLSFSDAAGGSVGGEGDWYTRLSITEAAALKPEPSALPQPSGSE